VSVQPLEPRIARLEGAYEQIPDRLSGLEQRMTAGFAQVDARFGRLEQKVDSNFRTTITWMLGQTAVILGAFAAFALHR
jgi:hypothetical protein